MTKKFSFWLNAASIMLLLTAAFHSMSFFASPSPKNETEKQLFDLASNYHPDAGLGFHPSFMDLFTGLSLCFTLICLFGAAVNWYFKKKNLPLSLWKGLLLIETVIFGCVFLAMLVFTFAAPVICTLMIFVFLAGAFLNCKT